MLGCKPTSTPIYSKRKLGCEEKGVPIDKRRFEHLVGRLIYLTHAQPDIGFAVSVVSQFINHPMEEHMEAVHQILKYLKMTPRKGLLFKKNGCKDIVLYFDAGWARSQIDRKSTIEYCSLV